MADELGPNGPKGPNSQKLSGGKRWASWTWEELETLWRHPDMTARELAALLPRHTERAVKNKRQEAGRWRSAGVTPICQRCGQHPVWREAGDGRRWGLCKECTIAERRYRMDHGPRLDRADNALR